MTGWTGERNKIYEVSFWNISSLTHSAVELFPRWLRQRCNSLRACRAFGGMLIKKLSKFDRWLSIRENSFRSDSDSDGMVSALPQCAKKSLPRWLSQCILKFLFRLSVDCKETRVKPQWLVTIGLDMEPFTTEVERAALHKEIDKLLRYLSQCDYSSFFVYLLQVRKNS
jgi:hypothetical protein